MTTVVSNNDGTFRLPSGIDFSIDSFPASCNVQFEVYGENGGAIMIESSTDADDVRGWLIGSGIDDENEIEDIINLISAHFNAMDEVWW